MPRTLAPILLALPLLGGAASCAALTTWLPGGPERIPAKLDAGKVAHAIEEAEADLAAGRTERALRWMRAASAASGLPPEQRDRVQTLMEEAARRRIDELSAPGADPEPLADLVDLDLPRQLAVTAGIRAARRMFESGEPMDAFHLIKKIDTRYPLHHERAAAGELLAEIGLSLAADESRFLFFFSRADDAQEVLEYLILHDPWASRCDEAYAALARMYTDESEWKLAIDRLEKLVLNHPQSPLRTQSQARIPHLRLGAIRSPEYDRAEILRARRELEDWLRTWPGHEMEPAVRLDLADCLRRLSDSDRIIAAFYDRVHNVFGARRHAQRAVEEARQAGDEERARDAELFLASLPPEKPAAGGRQP